MIMMTSRQWMMTVAGIAILLALPLLLPNFWLVNIFGRALVYGVVALSLTFLAHYGGFVSLAQTMVAGVAGYTVAIMAPTAIPLGPLAMPYGAAIPLAVIAATIAGAIVGMIAVNTREIYLLMITLALAVGFSLFAQSNITWFRGYEGIRNIVGPEIMGMPFRTPMVFYYISLIVAVLMYLLVLYVVRTPFGLVLQAIRDSDRRTAAIGFHVGLHRIASFALAGFIAGWGGVLITFYNIGITPSSIGLWATVGVLIMAVIGGLGHPLGAFIGALIYVVMDTFASSIIGHDRFNTLIGLVFLAIVLLSPDGVWGAGKRLLNAFGKGPGKPAPKEELL
ncbi:MAG: branched-chain amino acid ABC transporter permease [Rhodobacteraceae bacterium]|nr:branched-chain amino acid ABC transporter permease [Paracoccaceae bacterium]